MRCWFYARKKGGISRRRRSSDFKGKWKLYLGGHVMEDGLLDPRLLVEVGLAHFLHVYAAFTEDDLGKRWQERSVVSVIDGIPPKGNIPLSSPPSPWPGWRPTC